MIRQIIYSKPRFKKNVRVEHVTSVRDQNTDIWDAWKEQVLPDYVWLQRVWFTELNRYDSGRPPFCGSERLTPRQPFGVASLCVSDGHAVANGVLGDRLNLG